MNMGYEKICNSKDLPWAQSGVFCNKGNNYASQTCPLHVHVFLQQFNNVFKVKR
jgi:hypothetical protein